MDEIFSDRCSVKPNELETMKMNASHHRPRLLLCQTQFGVPFRQLLLLVDELVLLFFYLKQVYRIKAIHYTHTILIGIWDYQICNLIKSGHVCQQSVNLLDNKICCSKSYSVSAAAIFPVPGELQLQETENIKLYDIIILWSSSLLQGNQNCNWNECSTNHVIKGAVRRLKELRHAI